MDGYTLITTCRNEAVLSGSSHLLCSIQINNNNKASYEMINNRTQLATEHRPSTAPMILPADPDNSSPHCTIRVSN